MLLGHGDDGARYAKPIRANFSSNVRSDDTFLQALRCHLFAKFSYVSAYPEVLAESLATAIAQHEGVGPENVLITNGATAAIYLIAQAYRGQTSRVIVPTFSEYEDASVLHGHTVAFGTRDEFIRGRLSDQGLLWLCNPNNPTGEVFSREELLEQVERFLARVHVIDGAYQELCDAVPLAARDVCTRENLLLVRSLTKLFPVPGLRLGYVLGSAERIRRLSLQCAPWSVNSLAIETGKFLLPRRKQMGIAALEDRVEVQRFQQQIDRVPGFQAHASSTHFFLVEMKEAVSGRLKTWLLERHGLLIRDASNFRGLDERFIRIAAQKAEENRWLIEALTQWNRLS